MIRLDQLGQMPTWITIVVIAVLAVCLFVGIPLARRAGVKAAALARTDNAVINAAATDHGRDRLALFAALAPSVLVWLAVMGVSFIGLTGFAADFMQWRHWTNMLVPLSLDGISVSFGGWAFVAVKRGRHPGRAYRIVLAAASVSAMLNFVHGRQVWSIWTGIYLAFVSLAGMAMFHEMLDQFTANYDDKITSNIKYPRFGQRWLWAPISTLKARRAWIVYPPPEGTRPTINNALAHWRAVKRMSRAPRIGGETPWLTDGHSAIPAIAQADPLSHEPAPSPSALRFEPANSSGGNHSTPATGTGAGHASPHGSSNHRAEVPAPHAKPTADNRERKASRTGGRPASNAQVNAAAEQLWIEHKQRGTELTGAQLLELFRRQYPHDDRRPRWAAHRCKAARARYTAAEAARPPGELDDQEPTPLEDTQPSQTQPQPTS